MHKRSAVSILAALFSLALLAAGCGAPSKPVAPPDSPESKLKERIAALRRSYEDAVVFGQELERVRAVLLPKAVFTVPKNGTFTGPSAVLDATNAAFPEWIAELRIDRRELRDDAAVKSIPPSGAGKEIDDAIRDLEAFRLQGEVTHQDLSRVKEHLGQGDSPLAAVMSGRAIIYLRPPRAFGRVSFPWPDLTSGDITRTVWNTIKSVVVIKPVGFEHPKYRVVTGIGVGGTRDFVDQLECFVFSWPSGELLAAYRTAQIAAPPTIPEPPGFESPFTDVTKWLVAHTANQGFLDLASLYHSFGASASTFSGSLMPAIGRASSFNVDLAETAAGRVSCAVAYENGRFTKFEVSAFGERRALSSAQMAQLTGYPVESLTAEVYEEQDWRPGPAEGRSLPLVRLRLAKERGVADNPDRDKIQIDYRPGQAITVAGFWSDR